MRPRSRRLRRRRACLAAPGSAWQRTVRYDCHGQALVRYVAEVELELGTAYGPTQPVRLVVATLDPATLQPESTWYVVTSLPLGEASAEQVDAVYRLREWIAHCYTPAKQELGWADYQLRPERAMVRHWQLVLLAFTFSLLVGTLPQPAAGVPHLSPDAAPAVAAGPTPDDAAAGGTSTPRQRVRGAGRLARHARQVRAGGVAVPVGTPAGVVAPLVEQRPTARVGRAPRPRRPRPPA
jgi:hypothetical protein